LDYDQEMGRRDNNAPRFESARKHFMKIPISLEIKHQSMAKSVASEQSDVLRSKEWKNWLMRILWKVSIRDLFVIM